VVAPLATSRKPPEIEAVPPLPNATSPPSTASAFKAADSLFYEYKCQCSQRAARYRQYRWPEGRSERYAEIAAELVRLKVDVIVTFGSATIVTAKQATSDIPIVAAHLHVGHKQRRSRFMESGPPTAPDVILAGSAVANDAPRPVAGSGSGYLCRHCAPAWYGIARLNL
jgi:hypothetical protein